MKEKNLYLSSEELQYMLQGSLQWLDVAPRITASNSIMRKLDEAFLDEPAVPKLSETILRDEPYEKVHHSTRFEGQLQGQPVIWLLGSVGLLTLSSWFYFVLFSK